VRRGRRESDLTVGCGWDIIQSESSIETKARIYKKGNTHEREKLDLRGMDDGNDVEGVGNLFLSQSWASAIEKNKKGGRRKQIVLGSIWFAFAFYSMIGQ
jgi:hypothetical protein